MICSSVNRFPFMIAPFRPPNSQPGGPNSWGKVTFQIVQRLLAAKRDLRLPSELKKLDRFDALCNDLTTGLPAEIEARQKQYEYYRDKLLTFKELGA